MTGTTRRLAFVAPTGAPHKRPRLEKAIRIAQAAGDVVDFWGWRREATDPMGMDLLAGGEARVLAAGGAGASARKLGYIRYMIGVFWGALTAPKGRTFWALGLETAAAVWAAGLLRPRRYIFDDADRLVLTAPPPKPLLPLVLALEKAVARSAIAHIVPMVERYDYDFGKFVVLPNLPDKALVVESQKLMITPPSARLRVYASGWLGPNRGSRMIEGAARRLLNEEIIFVIATNARDLECEPLFKLQNVVDLGFVPQAESLAWCRACDVSLTFYDPALPINRMAAPNKWGDALICGRPFIVNSEVKTATGYRNAGAAFAVEWDNDDALARLLKELSDSPDRLRAADRAMATFCADAPSYEQAIEAILRRVR